MFIIEEIDTVNDFDLIRRQWGELLEKVSDHTIFQTYDYVRTWWQIFGKNRELKLLVVKKLENGKVAAIIPFYMRKHYGFKILQLIGDNFADYVHFLSLIDADQLSEALAMYLIDNRDWDCSFLNGVVCGSMTDRVLKILTDKGFVKYQYKLVKAPKLRMSSGWEKFYENLGKKTRKDTEYNLRRLAKIGELSMTSISGNKIKPNLDTFFKMHKKRWQEADSNSIFNNADNRKFFEEIAEKFDKQGRLAFSNLMIDQEVLAMHFGFKYNKQFYYYIPAYNIAYSQFSVGRILTLELIKQCYRENYESFDFMAGDEKYKYRFSNEETELKRVCLINQNVKGYLYGLLKFKNKLLCKRGTSQ